jgi:GT2 family glycosyltransferase
VLTREPQPRAARAESLRVSVITCAYTEGRWDALVQAVTSARAQDPAPDEVIVVIDHNARLLDRARDHFSGVTIVSNENGRGLSGARNTGVRCASGDLLVFLDDDARAKPGWIASLVRAFDDPLVIGAGGTAVPRWESDPPAWIPPEFLWVVGCSYRGVPKRQQAIRNPIGANMVFHRAAFERVGGFVEGIGRLGRLPLGCEETEFAIRAAAALGGIVVQVPGAEVEHRVSAQRTTWRYYRQRCWSEGISKALVARHVGRDAALASERDYVARVLPSGVCRELRQSIRGQGRALARAGAICAGFAITLAGYIRGRIFASAGPRA